MRARVVIAALVLGGLTACEDPEPTFGQPGGLRRRQGVVEGGCPKSPTAPALCPSWDDVYVHLNGPLGGTPNTDGTQGCGKNGCHQLGDPNAMPNPIPVGEPPLFSDDSAADAYASLAAYNDPANPDEEPRPYIASSGDPWITCNLSNDLDVQSQFPMPIGASVAADADAWQTILDWAACGMPGPGGGAVGSGGGGTGGELGVGGAGGQR